MKNGQATGTGAFLPFVWAKSTIETSPGNSRSKPERGVSDQRRNGKYARIPCHCSPRTDAAGRVERLVVGMPAVIRALAVVAPNEVAPYADAARTAAPAGVCP